MHREGSWDVNNVYKKGRTKVHLYPFLGEVGGVCNRTVLPSDLL